MVSGILECWVICDSVRDERENLKECYIRRALLVKGMNCHQSTWVIRKWRVAIEITLSHEYRTYRIEQPGECVSVEVSIPTLVHLLLRHTCCQFLRGPKSTICHVCRFHVCFSSKLCCSDLTYRPVLCDILLPTSVYWCIHIYSWASCMVPLQ